MNRLTSLALAAMLTPALALGVGSAFADERDADRDTQSRSTDRSDMTSDEGHGAGREDQSDSDGQPGLTGQDGDRQDQHGSSDRSDMFSGDEGKDDRSHTRYDDADDQEDHVTSKPEGGHSADDLIGQDVKNRNSDENVGTVNDILIDRDGKVVGVVIGTGGRLGIGERNVAVKWDRLQLSGDGDETELSIDMDEDALENAPEYESD